MSNNTDTDTHPMPLLVIEAEGKIITSNFTEFAEQVRTRLGEFNSNLRTDEDFDQAAEDVKIIAGAEASLKAAKEKALADAEELNALFSQIDTLDSELAKARLSLSKQIETQKTKLRTEIITTALTQLECDPSQREGYRASLEGAIKGKKNFATMREAVRIQVAIGNDGIRRAKRALDEFEQANGKTMTMDRRELEVKSFEYLTGELRRRLEASQAEAERKRLAEEAARQREAAEKARAELAEASKPPARPPRKPTAADVTDMPWDAPKPAAAPEAEDRWLPDPDDDTPQAEIEQGIDRLVEWNEFATSVEAAFVALKPARERLTDPVNKAIAQRFAEAVNTAWEVAYQ